MMRKYTPCFWIGLLLLLTSCPRPVDPAYSDYKPIFMSRAQLETSITKKPPMPITNPGKIYRYGNYLFINEQYKGIHLIDNQDPRNPINIAFIQVPGAIDFAVKDSILFVDNAIDLVAIDIHDVHNVSVRKRMRDVFPKLNPPDNLISREYLEINPPADAIIVGWQKKKNES